jgi:hypothetical protein
MLWTGKKIILKKELVSFLPEFFVRVNRKCLKTLRKLFKIHETVQIQTIHL